MRKKGELSQYRRLKSSIIILTVLLFALLTSVYFLVSNELDYRSKAQNAPTLQLGTFNTPTPRPTSTPPPPTEVPESTNAPTPTTSTSGPTPTTTPPPESDSPPPPSKQYCVDEEPTTVLIEPCDDCTRCDIAHGGGGPSNTCGTVIGWQHTIMEYLLKSGSYGANDFYVDLSTDILSKCYTAAKVSPYISTFNVIDSYNLAGFQGLFRTQHISAASLENAWKTTPGYTHQNTVQGVTPGYAIFTGSNHVGIVNTVEIDSNGNGHMWFLHTGASYYLGKLIVANWTVVASSTGDTSVRLGGHQSQGPDATQGETVCYCGCPDNICYRWTF